MKKNTTIKNIISGIVSLIISVIVLFPFYWLLISALKTEKDIFSAPPTLFPKQITFENFIHVLQRTKIAIYFKNSIINAGLTVIVVVFVGSLAAYSISRFKFKGKKMLFILILIGQIMPLTTLIVPLYVLFGNLNLFDSHISLIATYSAMLIPVAIWLLTGYFNTIPKEIDEAAIIDGCSKVGILTRIIMPLAKPGIMAVSLTVVITVWQELMLAMTFTNKDSMRPLMAGVNSFITRSGIQWGPLNASGVLTCIPIIIIFMFAQKALVKGLTSGSVKG